MAMNVPAKFEWWELLIDIDLDAEGLNEKEIHFVDDMIDRYERYGADAFISRKQYEFLESIWNRYIRDISTARRIK